MPVLFKKKSVLVRVGFECDMCKMTDDTRLNDFSINHTLGYDSPADMTTITAALCDACLLSLVLDHIPGAAITSEGKAVSRAELAVNLARHQKQVADHSEDSAKKR